MGLHRICETIFSEPRTAQRRSIMFLLIGVIVLTYWGCGSSNDSDSSRVTEGNGSGLRLAIQMPSGFDPAIIDRFEISVTGPGIPLYSRVNSVGTAPISVALGDVNGDQVLDVVTANRDSNDVSILLGIGNGIFFSAQRFFVEKAPSSVALVSVQDAPFDVNDDGFLDIITANRDANTVFILRSDPSLKNIRHTADYKRVTINERDQLVFYLTLSEEVKVPLGPNRTFTVQAFPPNASQPNFIGRTTQTILSRDTSVVVTLTLASSSE